MEAEKKNKNKSVMKKSFSLREHRTKWLHYEVIFLSNTYIYTYINPQTQSGYRAITQSYAAHQPCMGRYCRYNQYVLLKISMLDKHNCVIIVNTE